MANKEHLAILKQGVEVWNRWREENSHIRPDLSGVRLSRAKLSGANLSGANLSSACLWGAHLERAHLERAQLLRAELWGARLERAHLERAHLSKADLRGAHLERAHLERARLSGANFLETHLSGAYLSGADLSGAYLVGTDLVEADLTGCRIYGISAWDLKLKNAKESDLIITRPWESIITVDNLEVAQFVYLLLHNPRIRSIIDTIGKKTVLILGSFTKPRKAILDALRDSLRKHNYIPILFDFEKPTARDLTETIVTLAHLSRFIIADITDPSSIPKELEAIVPRLAVPVQPLLAVGGRPYAMFVDNRKYKWVLKTYHYEDLGSLISHLPDKVIGPAERKAEGLERRRNAAFQRQG